ncbi:ATP/GTP-binding protein [Mangrovactinospora gilvigrisea]|uniref:ATP/GTP-binding protein n=1 Tax=Mangrovactinospora gilvigrisea TaxID=1428644 RepID=A0A1J7BIK9_9ACTN|nr:HpcH/HpaI aldolase/citrate lyase family protein [Mangrovactinospora gilvigrisea]OIV38503.1 ATP/GTP-binding protein [Mangrovactinospora gilvigrisea]
MRHFGHLGEAERNRLFHLSPEPFARDTSSATLAAALGATLYAPATRPRLAADVRRQAARGVVSMVLCLEDAIPDDAVPAAEENLVAAVAELAADASDAAPLLFVRVRHPRQIGSLTDRMGASVGRLSGWVLPKFDGETGAAFLDAAAEAEDASGHRMLAMPVLESPELAHLETRREELSGIADAVEKHRERVPALRLGVADLCAAYGLRRSPDLTAYDLQVVAGVIGDVVNVFGRLGADGDPRFVITGPVWEYFPLGERVLKPQLRASPFGARDRLRSELLAEALDGLIREVELDRHNGLVGKTVIHPSHVGPVHAMSVVSHEEWSDAGDLLGRDGGGGVLRSAYTNKMNEVNPHRAWARGVARRARAFGVAREGVSFADLLEAFDVGTVEP